MPKLVPGNHYQTLGLSPTATAEEIKKRYRELAQECHPDTLGPDANTDDVAEANELFTKISIAYQQLSDADTRRAVDNGLGYHPQPTRVKTSRDNVPPCKRYWLGGVHCRVEFHREPYSLSATIWVEPGELARLANDVDLPFGAWLKRVVVIDKAGEIIGQNWSIASLRHNLRRLHAEARRAEARRGWDAELAPLEDKVRQLGETMPVDELRSLLFTAQRHARSGEFSLRGAEAPDTVRRAIRELEKAIERFEATDVVELVVSGIFEGKIHHSGHEYNKQLLTKLKLYELRSGGAYEAPTEEQVAEHYRRQLERYRAGSRLERFDLKLPDDEPTVLELAKEGVIELAPATIELPGNRGSLRSYPVKYGWQRIDGDTTPVGIITISHSVFTRHAAEYGQASQFPSLPHGIPLLVRVEVSYRERKMTSQPRPDGQPLRTEVQRCLKRMQNPKSGPISSSLDDYLMVLFPF